MRKLLNTLYVSNPKCFLSIDNETVLVKLEDEVALRLPLINLEGIVTCGYGGASLPLMSACAKRGITISFMTDGGRYLGTFVGESRGNILLRKQQYRISDSLPGSTGYAKAFMFGKLHNARWLIERATRDYPLRVDVDRLKNVSGELKRLYTEIYECLDMDRIRVLEAAAAQYSFGCLNELILQNKDVFHFESRTRRPPLDPLNALLSFTYSMLAHDLRGACEAVGLDAYCGFMHRDRPGRASLALDLMEELRPCVADRFVLTLINLRKITGGDFVTSESGAVALTDGGRRKYFDAWQEHKREVITHPFLKEKLEWGLVPYAQALLLARTIRGDLDEYPPFLWK